MDLAPFLVWSATAGALLLVSSAAYLAYVRRGVRKGNGGGGGGAGYDGTLGS